jgi:hypothetical protein
MRQLAALALATLVASPSLAQQGCPQDRAVYAEKDNGYILSFRKPDPWEASANTLAILDLAFPDKQHLWGWIWIPNGTSHDKIEFFTPNCTLPTLDPSSADGDPTEGSSDAELDACSVWDGVILALANDDIEPRPFIDSPGAATTPLLPNRGPTIRYSGLVLSPGDEPHDVFTFKECGS